MSRVLLRDVLDDVLLGDIVESRAGKTPSRSEPAYWGGDVPWLTAKDLKTHRLSSSIERISQRAVEKGAPLAALGDVLILVRGMTLLKDVPLGVVEVPVSFNQDVRCLHPKEDHSGEYLAYLLLAAKDRLLGAVTQAGHGTGRLDGEQLMNLPLRVPPATVQKWLVERLRSVTRVIDKLDLLIAAKRELKRGLMQDLLTGRRRFPEFADSHGEPSTQGDGASHPWRTATLGEIAEPIARRNRVGEARVLTCSGEHGLIDQTEYFTKSVAGESIEDYYLLNRGEFAYNRSSMKGYPFGATKRLERYERGVVSTLNICFALTKDWEADFAAQYFESGLLNEQLRRVTRVGVDPLSWTLHL